MEDPEKIKCGTTIIHQSYFWLNIKKNCNQDLKEIAALLCSLQQYSKYPILRVGQKKVYSHECVKQFIFVLLINYCITFHTKNCKHTFAFPKVNQKTMCSSMDAQIKKCDISI